MLIGIARGMYASSRGHSAGMIFMASIPDPIEASASLCLELSARELAAQQAQESLGNV